MAVVKEEGAMTGIEESKAIKDEVPTDVLKDEVPTEGLKDEVPKAVIKEEGISELESKIIRQIEYYFGDYNISRDKFLQEEIKKDEGWIALAVMLKFNRLAQMSKDESVVAGAVAKSGLMEVHDDKTKIRRNPDRKIPEFDSSWKEKVQARTLYMKGFPAETVLDDLQPFVDKVCQSENVFMRRLKNGTFKGSIFVTYQSEEDCKKLLDMKCKKYREEDEESLIIKFQKDYFAEKKDGHKERRNADKKDKPDNKADSKDLKQGGAVLKIEGLNDKEISFDDIKSAFRDKVEEKVAWVTYGRGADSAQVRFSGEQSAVSVIKSLEGKLTIGEKEFTISLVEGEEEEEYWETFKRDAASKKDKDSRGFQGGRGGGFRGRGSGRGRGRGGGGGRGGGDHKRDFPSNDDEPTTKKSKPNDEVQQGSHKRDFPSNDDPVCKKSKPNEGQS